MSASSTLTSIYPSSNASSSHSSLPSAEASNKKITAFTIDLDGNNNRQNLQDAFRKYREYKVEGEKLNAKNEAMRKLRRHFRSDPERMRNLRLKFVEQAKLYFGIPYKKINFPPDSPEYNSKLFLDCCGLVRRVMRDLEKDFGFRIGPGNQAYMFDTLPKTIENIKDVKPGDLVFIQAVYYNPKMKIQPHNITHVEIMLGEGEKTIGARWNNGKVQEFESYKFESKSYHIDKYIFKSIDPWILGLCRSYCYKHGWKYNTNTSKLSKRSIFSSGYLNLNDLKKRAKSSTIKSLSTKKKLKRKKRKKSKKPLIDLNYSENPSQLSLQSLNLDSSLNENNRNKSNLSMIRTLGETNDFSSESSCSENASEVEDEDAEAEEYIKTESENNSEYQDLKFNRRAVRSAFNLVEKKHDGNFLAGSSHQNINDKSDIRSLNIDQFKNLNIK